MTPAEYRWPEAYPRPIAETTARRHWFHLGEIMSAGEWLAVVTFENGNESIRPCATRKEARAYAKMQHAYGDVKTAVRRASS